MLERHTRKAYFCMRKSRWATGLIAGGAITAAMATAPHAIAASPVLHARHSGYAALVASAGQAAPQHVGQPNDGFAGYNFTPSSGVSSATTRFRIPSVTCGQGDIDVLGVGVYAASADYQAGSDDTADLQSICPSGEPIYYIDAYTPSGGQYFAVVNAGDQVVASLSEDGTTVTATVQDVTAGITVTSSGAAALDTEVFTGAYNYGFPVPDFAPFKVSNSRVNGDALGDAPSLVALKMQPTGGPTEVAPTRLNKIGQSFTLIRRNATA